MIIDGDAGAVIFWLVGALVLGGLIIGLFLWSIPNRIRAWRIRRQIPREDRR